MKRCCAYAAAAEKPRLPDNYEERTWFQLKDAVHAIHARRAIDASLEELYQAVENMCSHKMAAQLYAQLKAICEEHIKSNIDLILKYPCSVIFASTP